MIAKKIQFLLLAMVLSISLGSKAFAFDGDDNAADVKIKDNQKITRLNNCIDPDPNIDPTEGPDAGLTPEYRNGPDDADARNIPECGPCSGYYHQNLDYGYRENASSCHFSCGDVGGEWSGRCGI